MANDPANRLKPSGDGFVAADLMVPSVTQPVAVETIDPPTVDLVDDRRLIAEPLTTVVEPAAEPASLPVVETGTTPAAGGLFADRTDGQRFWHLPGYEVGLADGPLFEATVSYRGPNASGEQVTRYRGAIEIRYETVETYEESAWEERRPSVDSTLSPIPLELETADLDLTYYDGEGKTTRRIQGQIDRANRIVRFEPQGDFLKVAYQNLAKVGSATLALRGRFEAWRERTDEERPIVNPSIVRPLPVAEPLETVPEIRNPVALNQRIPNVERTLTDGGGPSIGFDPSVLENLVDPDVITPITLDSLPEIEEEDVTYVRQQFAVEQEVTLDFPCRDHLDQYVEIDGGVTESFGCNPPWSSGADPGERYDRLTLDWVPEGVTIYASRAEADRFLLVPRAYVITRNQESNVPMVSVVNASDPEDETASSVRLGLTVGPDLTTFERALIEQGLYEWTTERNGEPAEPVVELPTTVPAVSTKIDWQGGLGADVRHYPNGIGHTLQLTYESLSDAAIALSQLRGDHGAALGGRITIDSEGQDLGSTSIVADVNRTTGPVVSTRDAAEGGVAVTNDCESPVRVERAIFYTDGQPGYEIVSVEPQAIGPGETVAFDDAEPDGDFQNVAVHYQIDEKPDRALDEDFVEIDYLEAAFTVTVSLDANRRGIERLETVVTFPETDQRETVTLVPDGEDFGGVSETVAFTLPITTYLEPAERTARFRATVVYEGETPDHVSPWRRVDLAETSRIDLDPDTLQLEENP